MKHSTDTCLSLLNDKILTGIYNLMSTCMIFIDIHKAFDTINHEISFSKMVHLGFSQATISWYKYYLTNRTFLVNVEKTFPHQGILVCGVPQ